MFTELYALLGEPGAKLDLAITRGQDNSLTVMLNAKASQMVVPPLVLTATPEELDEGLPGVLANYSLQRQSLLEQFEANMTIMNAEKEAQLLAARAGSNKGASKSAVDDGDDDDDGDNEGGDAVVGGGTQAVATVVAPAAATEVQKEFSLFD